MNWTKENIRQIQELENLIQSLRISRRESEEREKFLRDELESQRQWTKELAGRLAWACKEFASLKLLADTLPPADLVKLTQENDA